MNIELRLLSTMLKYGDFGPVIRNDINVEHFGTAQGQQIFNFIANYKHATDGAAKWPSLAIVRERFKGAHVELPDPDPADTIDNLTHEVRVAKFRSELREFAFNAETIAEGSTDPIADIAPIFAKVRKAAEAHVRVQHANLASALPDVVEQYKAKEILPEGMPFPWPTLNKATKGMHPGEFLAIVGRPKSRKTFTALRILCHAVKHNHRRALIFTPEMPVRQMLLRCIAHIANLPYTEFKDGSMAAAEEARLYEIAQLYGRVKDTDDAAYQLQLAEKIPGLGDAQPSLDIVKSTGRDTSWLLQQIEIYQPHIVMVDSFYKQRSPGARKNDADWKTVTAVSRDLKDLAMDTNVCMIGTHQLNRGAQNSLGDISNVALADAISQDTDGMYRVVTGKINGMDVSALYAYAARDAETEGVLINNRPCYDYSEIGAIASRQQVIDLMKQEDIAIAEEEKERLGKATTEREEEKRRSVHTDFGRRSSNRSSKFTRSKRPMEHKDSGFSRQLDEDFKLAMQEDV